MREILFRGKRVDNGEWVEGGIIPLDIESGYVFIAEPYLLASTLPVYEIVKNHTRLVIPETIGQHTGLTDKNGKKIFEGDIVKTQPFYDRPYSNKRKSKQFIGVVEYKIRTFKGNSFYSKQDYQAEWGLKFYEDFEKYTHYSWGELWICEVIGNIHDNPELLKEGAE